MWSEAAVCVVQVWTRTRAGRSSVSPQTLPPSPCPAWRCRTACRHQGAPPWTWRMAPPLGLVLDFQGLTPHPPPSSSHQELLVRQEPQHQQLPLTIRGHVTVRAR